MAAGACAPQLSTAGCAPVRRRLREAAGVDVSSFMTSLCGDQALRQLGELGKSRSVFFLSHGRGGGGGVGGARPPAWPRTDH
jgi:hypothetical protein